jgi:predicted membrane chloride channel (bestrophin family)
MPIAYDPKDPFKTILAANIKRTVNTRSYYGTLFMFCILRVTVSVVMSADEAKKLDTMLTYPMSLVGTLFSFLIGFFMNNCYTRFMDNWRAAMIGWSRMNDLALQVPPQSIF